ncbi:MAG: PQQ-dependent sugar dehydrogenase [Bdellovibrionales bacterium]|nr:PQQ-dependent sugar dehydrogenase [Bdellovibrionales bacterium]
MRHKFINYKHSFFIIFAFLFSQSYFLSLAQSSSVQKKDSQFELLFENKTNNPPFKVEIIAKDLGIPWGMVFLNEKELLWTEKQGKVKKINLETKKISPISLSIKNLYYHGQGGLLDVALHPNFKQNQWVYFSYGLSVGKKQTTALGRAKLKGNKMTSFKTLFLAQDDYNSNRHFGSRMQFDDKGFLFITIGDRAKKKEAQNLSSHLGKLLRLDENGKAVKDNPFFNTKGAKPEIYSYGHRNPQGLFIHPETKEIYLQEHGPRGGDEINLIKKGRNYGWPVITHGRAYSGLKIGEGTHKKGMEQPIKYWVPSIAPSSLLIYSGKKFPNWLGNFFSSSLVLTHLNRLQIQNNKVIKEDRLLSNLDFRFRHVIEGPKGFLYLSVDQGMILKLSPL